MTACRRCGFQRPDFARFCGVCGEAATQVISDPDDAIVVQAESKGGGYRGRLSLRLHPYPVSCEVRVRVPPGLARHLSLAYPTKRDAPRDYIATQLGPQQTSVEIDVLAANIFVLKRRPEIRIESLVPIAQPRLPVIGGGSPRFNFPEFGLDVYPDGHSGSGLTWTVTLSLLEGVARLRGISLELIDSDDVDVLAEHVGRCKLVDHTLPSIVREGDQLTIQVYDVPHIATDCKKVFLHLQSNDSDLGGEVRLWRRAPIDIHLSLHQASAEHRAYDTRQDRTERPVAFCESFATVIEIGVENRGSRPTQIIDLSLPAFAKLHSFDLQVPTESGGPHSTIEIRPSPVEPDSVPGDVQDALIPGASVDENVKTLDKIRIECRGAERFISEQRLPIPVELTVRDEEGTIRSVTLIPQVLARRVEPLPGYDDDTEEVDDDASGELAIDYGTVNTCACLYVDGQHPEPIGHPESGRIETQLKSCYEVVFWGSQRGVPRVMNIGLTAWDVRQSPSVDYVPKLRLGRPQTIQGRPNPLRYRHIPDSRSDFQRIDGVQAARTLLAHVLEQTARQSGWRPQRVLLTHPVAFEQGAIDDLRAACLELGIQDVQVASPEPVAYLRGVIQDPDCLNDILGVLEEWRAHFELDDAGLEQFPMPGVVIDMGGGTTDVTIFLAYGDDHFKVVTSFGYNWLGGEAITMWIAHFIVEGLIAAHPPSRAVLPEPCSQPEEIWECLLTPERSESVRNNVEDLRRIAEGLKTAPIDTRASTHSLSFQLDGLGGGSIDVVITEADLEEHVERFLARGFEDVIDRLRVLAEFGVINTPVPGVLVIAGNGGRLWCLGDVLDRCFRNILGDQRRESEKEETWQDKIWLLGPPNLETVQLSGGGAARVMSPQWDLLAKQAVVLGMGESESEGADVEPPTTDGRWWYFMTGRRFYHLALPAGFGVDIGWGDSPPDSCQDLPPGYRTHQPPFAASRGQSGNLVRVRRRTVYSSVSVGQLQIDSLDAPSGARFTLEGRIVPPAEWTGRMGQWAFGFRRQENNLGFGAYVRIHGGGAQFSEWRWLPVTRRRQRRGGGQR